MKDVKDMTLREIESLKIQYKEEFINVIKKFFDERPLIDRVFLYSSGITYSQAINVYRTNVDTLVNKVHLKID